MLLHSLHHVIRKIYQEIIPNVCLLCGLRSYEPYDLCAVCEKALPWSEHGCLQCGLPLITEEHHCGHCLQDPPPFEKTLSLFHYEEPIPQIISALKFGHQLNYAHLLGQLFLNQILKTKIDSWPDKIIPVPLHPQRLKERGFNQAIEILRPLAKYLNIQLQHEMVKRTRYTQAQTLVPANTRQKNLEGAFQIVKPVAGLSRIYGFCFSKALKRLRRKTHRNMVHCANESFDWKCPSNVAPRMKPRDDVFFLFYCISYNLIQNVNPIPTYCVASMQFFREILNGK
jgi:ComF family protein